MTAEIICVGTELLLGEVVNTNGAYLAQQCAQAGLSCYYQSVVGDNAQRLEQAIRTALSRSDIVMLSGGLGPTEDDLTKETAARVMGRELVMDEASRRWIEEYFAKKGVQPTDNNWKQALVPEGALVLPNPNGTAPGVILEGEKARIVLLPGPPHELIPMFEESVLPYLRKCGPGVIYSQTVKACGIGESRVESLLMDLIDAQSDPTIATYAKPGEVHIRVTAKAESEKAARKKIKPVVKELKSRLGAHIYTTEDSVTLERAVVDLLLANRLTVTCAESCTGGLLAARLIDVPGVSEVFKSGLVTYSNKAKRRLLGVKKSTLEKYGAVSEQTAREMARGAAFLSKSDVAVGITGLAGPDGGTPEKPVGLVYISCSVKGEITVKEYRFTGSRSTVRGAAVSAALVLMRRCILEYYSKVTFG